MLRPGEGEETATKRLLERVFANCPRYFDVVCGDALYFDASFLSFCLEHHKRALVVVKGEQRVLLRDAQGLFAQQPPQVWQERRRTVQAWDTDGLRTCEGARQPLRVVHTVETVHRRERVARCWQENDENSS